MHVAEQWLRHKNAVAKIAEKKQGISFNSAPFDIVDCDGIFYEVKTPSDLKGKHKGECRLTLSEDEKKFGDLFGDKFIVIIIFNEVTYSVPFSELEQRISRNRLKIHIFGGTERRQRQITLGKKFLQKYIEEQKGM